jgi:chemosensory pili system protein ChpA (sensor histidine kinase/response regulator)
VNPEVVNPEAVNPESVNPESVNPEVVNPEVVNKSETVNYTQMVSERRVLGFESLSFHCRLNNY